MATAFDGLGMGMLGSEKRFMTQGLTNADGTPTTAGLILGGLLGTTEKEKKVELPPFSIDRPASEIQKSSPPPANVAAEPVLPNASNASIPDNAGESEEHPDTQKAMEDLGFITPVVEPKPLTVGPLSAISPDLLKARNPAQDQIPMEMASAPPPQMSLPQYGKQGGGGGDALKMLSSLATLFI
jgi:hypothetical protein